MEIVFSVFAVLITVALVVLTIKSKKADLFKWIGIFILVALMLTWILPYGTYQGETFIDRGMLYLGLSDMPGIVYKAIYFGLTTIIYLFTIGGFYGVLSKTNEYQKLVGSFAEGIKGREIVISVVYVVLITVLTSILKNALVLLVFIPFLISVLLKAKFDKVTVMGITFGSILVGTLAATIGTESLYFFNYYLDSNIKVGLVPRIIFALIIVALYAGFTAFKVHHMLKDSKRINETKEDLFAVEEIKDYADSAIILLVMLGLAIFIIFGYINWNETFGIGLFDTIHTWLSELKITIGDKQYFIFKMLLGSSSLALGELQITSLINALVLATLFVALVTRTNLHDALDNYLDGFKKILKPIIFFALAYVVFIIAYTSPFMATVTDWAIGLTKKFNPFIMSLTAFITSVFHADLGYTSYLVGTGVTTLYAANLADVHTIYVITYGLTQLLAPTSAILLVGLSYLKIDYKKWMKHIWMFGVAAIVVFLILITVMTYWV